MANNLLAQVKQISLREAEETSDTSLFVVNMTQPRGDLSFSITTSRGRDFVVTVPDTWVPYDLSAQAKKTEIIEAPDFRRAVSRGFLLLVETASADALFLNDDRAQVEIRRIYNKNGGNNNIANNSSFISGMDMKREEVSKVAGVQAGIQANAGEDGESVKTGVQGSIIQIVTRSNIEGPDGMDPKEAVSLLMGQNLNPSDYDYIIKNSNQESLKQFAAKQLG